MDPAILLDRAVALFRAGRLDEAVPPCLEALAAAPRLFEARYLLGAVRAQQNRFEEALAQFDAALALRPGAFEVHFNRGNALFALGRMEAALQAYDRAVAIAPGFAPGWNNRGNVLKAMARPQEALAAYDRVIELDPAAATIFANRADMLAVLGREAEALASLDRCLALAPGMGAGWARRGALLRRMGHAGEALESFTRAAACDPDNADAWLQCGTLQWLERQALAPAIAHLTRAVALDPNLPYARGLLLHLKMLACDWTGFDTEAQAVTDGVRAGARVIEPFAFQAISSSPGDLRACASIFSRDRYLAQPAAPFPARGEGRIRLGYLSGEFREQATAHLTAGLYEAHDRSRFELVALDNGADDGSAMRRRLEAAFDRVMDIKPLNDEAAAAAVRAAGVDILVDLNGYFSRHRTGLLAHKPAPVQVNWLGFPGTMAAPYMDYLIADAVVIPPGEEGFYGEQVARLPHSYQANDRRAIAPVPARAACGLPENGFVFCNFNNSYKFTPGQFARWMRLLAQVEGSVLWLLQANALCVENLRRAASASGIAPERLVFAPHLPLDRHLARLSLADLTLDSLPYNQHTTGSDALWAGVPLLTCRGSAFAGRVGASLLTAVGLPDLITENPEDYDALALRLARAPRELDGLRRKLAEKRLTAPLFDTARFARHLEAAYEQMWARHRAGEAPRGFDVADTP